MAKFTITPTIHTEKVLTVRLGGNALATRFNDSDVGKPVKLAAESQYSLCAAGDAIEGIVTSYDATLYDSFVLGGIVKSGYANAVAGGSQAAGTGAIAVGDYVLAAAPSAVQTALATTYLKVVKATDQAAAATAAFKARVVSLGTAGSGAVGTNIVIELL